MSWHLIGFYSRLCSLLRFVSLTATLPYGGPRSPPEANHSVSDTMYHYTVQSCQHVYIVKKTVNINCLIFQPKFCADISDPHRTKPTDFADQNIQHTYRSSLTVESPAMKLLVHNFHVNDRGAL